MNFIFLMLLAICFASEDRLMENVMLGGYRVQDDTARNEAIQTIYEPMMRLEKSQLLADYLQTYDVDKQKPVKYLTQLVAGTNHKFIWDDACGGIELIIWQQLSFVDFKANIQLPGIDEPISFDYTKAETEGVENVGNLAFGSMMCGGQFAQGTSETETAISEIYYPMLLHESNPMRELLGQCGDPTSYKTQVVAGTNHIFKWDDTDLEVVIWQKLDGTYQATVHDNLTVEPLIFIYSV